MDLEQQMRTARTQVLEWVRRERAGHADDKFSAMLATQIRWHWDEQDQVGTLAASSGWWQFASNYLDRVRLFNLQSPQGRQALAKVICTLQDALATSIMLWGDLPEPGHPSGEIRPWTNGHQVRSWDSDLPKFEDARQILEYGR